MRKGQVAVWGGNKSLYEEERTRFEGVVWGDPLINEAEVIQINILSPSLRMRIT